MTIRFLIAECGVRGKERVNKLPQNIMLALDPKGQEKDNMKQINATHDAISIY